MSTINDLQHIADDLLARTTKIASDMEAIERGKETLRDATITAGQAIVLTSSLGVVKTKKGTPGGPTGEIVHEFDAEAFLLLPEDLRRALLQTGVVKQKPKVTTARKPSVEISLPSLAKAA